MASRNADAEGSLSIEARLPVDPWMRWRFGERVCVVCGGPPVGSIEFPTALLVELGLAEHGSPWRVPVCGRMTHQLSYLWPIRTQLALADEHRDTLNGTPPRVYELTIWAEM